MKWLQKAKWAYIIISSLMTALGVLLIVFPATSALTVCYAAGAISIVFGVIKLGGYFSEDMYRLAFQFDFALGIFALLAGVLLVLHPTNIVKLVPVILGVFIITDGAFKLQTSVDARRFGMRGWWGILLLAVLTCLSGLFLIINPFEGAQALMILLGVTLIIYGVQNLLVVLYTVKVVRMENQRSVYVDIKEKG